MDQSIDAYFSCINDARAKNGFMSIDDLYELTKTNTIYDIFSIIISSTVRIGIGNIIYPNVVIESDKSLVDICDNNTFYSGTRIVAKNGKVIIGTNNEIGENSVSIKSENTKIEVKNECRLNNCAQLLCNSYFGNGSQVLGNIKVINCNLYDGLSYKEINPNKRGGVLKGFGIANNLNIGIGKVINGKGIMTIDMIEDQEKYHPNWMNDKK